MICDRKRTANLFENFVIALFFILCWNFFFWVYPYHLYFKEQLTLFVMHSDYITAYLYKPAFLAEMAGDYLTQFYLLIGGGATILTFILVLLWWSIRSALKRLSIDRYAGLWALLPVVAEWALSCHIEYPLSMVIAITIVVWAYLAYASIKKKTVARIFGIIAVLCLYSLIGAHFVAFAILVAIYEIKNNRAFFYSLTVLSLVAIVPLVMSRFYYLTFNQAYFYPIIGGYMLQHHYMFLTTEIALLSAFILATYRVPLWIGIAVVSLCTSIGIKVMCDLKQEYVLAVSCEAYFGHWDNVLKMKGNDRYKTYIGAYYNNLALSREKRLPDEMMQFYQPAYHGLFLKINESVGYLNTMFSTDALMECGDMAQAQHSAMLAMTFTPHQRSSRMARKLVEIAIIDGDYDAANKFLWQLEHTSLHRKWALDRKQLLNNEVLCSVTSWVAEKRNLLPQTDTLFSPNEWFTSLRNLLESNPKNKVAVDYLLCFHLLDKNLTLFKEDYDRYYLPVFGYNPPRVYQEALIVSLGNSEDPAGQLIRYHIMHQVYDNCVEYIALHNMANGDGSSLQEQYGKTYWFYYYYAQIK